MGILDFLFKRKEPRSVMHDMIGISNPDACKADEIPKGIGKFGLVKTNPIPVYGIDNVPNYMEQLRYKYTSQKGIVLYYPIQYKRTIDSDNSEEGTSISDSSDTEASTSADNIGDYIDVYNIYSFDGERKLAKFYLHSYHWKTSVKVPEGFVNVSTVPSKQDGNKILELIKKSDL